MQVRSPWEAPHPLNAHPNHNTEPTNPTTCALCSKFGSSPYALTGMAPSPTREKRSRSLSPLNGACRVFKCADGQEIAISDENLKLLRGGGRAFAAMLDGGGGFGPAEDGATIFQRFPMAASVVANLVMAAKNTLEVETTNFEAVADASELVGGFAFVDELRQSEKEKKRKRV